MTDHIHRDDQRDGPDARAWCVLVGAPFAISTALTAVFVAVHALLGPGGGVDSLVRDGSVAVFALALMVSVVALAVREARR